MDRAYTVVVPAGHAVLIFPVPDEDDDPCVVRGEE